MKSKEKETTLLDSSLNTGQKSVQMPYLPNFATYIDYNIKIVDCKEYKQLYIFNKVKSHLISGFEKKSYINLNDLDLITKDKYKNDKSILEEQVILYRNVMRSKFKLQRVVKANEKDWKSFITLTFKDNITDLGQAYRIFRYFIKTIDRNKKDFKWVCVPEFQKCGKVHYHLVSNIDIEGDRNLLYTQELEDGKIEYHLKHWSKEIDKFTNLPKGKGYDCIETCKDKDGNDTKKLCGYISKYMSKAYIEDCFFNKNRYYLSQNLILPRDKYIDTNKTSDLNELQELLKDSDLLYQNEYTDSFGNTITFIEIKKTS